MPRIGLITGICFSKRVIPYHNQPKISPWELFRISNWGSERIDYIAPFQYLKKDEVLNVGIKSMEKLGFDKKCIKTILRNTHSCYDPNEKGESCGLCGTCQ